MLIQRGMGIIFMACILALFGCGDPKPPVHDPAVVEDGSTVYGEGSDGRVTSTEEVVAADPTLYSEEGSVDSQTMTLGDDQGGDWNWEPIFFDFDRAELTAQAKAQLEKYANQLARNRGYDVLLEGHCDERGTDTYNLALGERRAQTVKRYLLLLGVAGSQLKTISYGELRPLAVASDEGAWAKNRRVQFTFKRRP